MTLNLSLSKRFVAVLSLFVGMFVLVFYLLVQAKTVNIDFSKLELNGNKYQRPLEKLLNAVMQHRVVAQRALYGEKQSLSRLPDLQSAVGDALSALERVDTDLTESLQFTDQGLHSRKRDHFRTSVVSKEWSELKSKISNLKPSESNELHAHLINDIRTMITHAGDTSNLILDPDLDSYYLMDITLLALPQIQDRIQNIIVEVEPIIRRGHVTTDERVKASVFAAMINEADLARVTGDHQTILNEDVNFYGKSDTLESQLSGANQNFVTSYKELLNIINDVAEGRVDSPDKFVQVSGQALRESFDYWEVATTELDRLLDTRIRSLQNSKTAAITLSIAFLVFSLFMAFVFMRYLTRNIRGIVTVLSQSSREVSGASSTSAASATELSEASAEQAASLQQTMATIEEISAMVSQNAESAGKTKQAVEINQQASENGSRSVEDMLLAITDIKDTNEKILQQMEGSNKEFGEIVKIISEIGQKTNVINEIVFQTKLLSFNASVEAARAGEHGKGFAVVAEEVGNLAQMSGNAAKEITDMLSSSIKKVNTIVEDTKSRVDQLVEIGKDKIVMGQSTAQKCRESLNKITENAHTVSAMVTEITQASKEQAQGIQEITKAFSQLDKVTQQNAAVAQQSSAQAEQLNAESQSLSEAVTQLVIFVDGKATAVEEVEKEEVQKPEAKNVVAINRKKVVKPISSGKAFVARKASGSSVVPSSNDPNFEEF